MLKYMGQRAKQQAVRTWSFAGICYKSRIQRAYPIIMLNPHPQNVCVRDTECS